MSPIDQPNTPENRDKARSRLRTLTRGAIFAATGATVVIGVVVSRDHPGAGSTGKGAGATTSGSSSSVSTSAGSGTSSSSSSNTGSTGNTGNSGSSSSSPSISQSTPTVTSGGSSG